MTPAARADLSLSQLEDKSDTLKIKKNMYSICFANIETFFAQNGKSFQLQILNIETSITSSTKQESWKFYKMKIF